MPKESKGGSARSVYLGLGGDGVSCRSSPTGHCQLDFPQSLHPFSELVLSMPLIRSRGDLSGICPEYSNNAASSMSRVETQHNCEPRVRGECLQVMPACSIKLPKRKELRNV